MTNMKLLTLFSGINKNSLHTFKIPSNVKKSTRFQWKKVNC